MANYDRSFPNHSGMAEMGTFTGTGQTGNVLHIGYSVNAYTLFATRTSATEPSVLTVSIQGRMGATAPWVELITFTNASFVVTLDPSGTPIANAGASNSNTAAGIRLMPEMRMVTTGTWTGTGTVKAWMSWE